MTTDKRDERTAESRLIRMCPEGGVYVDADEIECPCDHDNGKTYRHRVTRSLVCSKCSQAYRNRKEFDSHECYDAI